MRSGVTYTHGDTNSDPYADTNPDSDPYADTNADGDSHPDSNANCNIRSQPNTNWYGDSDSYTYSHVNAQTRTNAEATPDSGTASIASRWGEILIRDCLIHHKRESQHHHVSKCDVLRSRLNS